MSDPRDRAGAHDDEATGAADGGRARRPDAERDSFDEGDIRYEPDAGVVVVGRGNAPVGRPCAVCGNHYDKAFQIRTVDGEEFTFDSFECAIHRLAPRCGHCDCVVIGHGSEVAGQIYCCAHCARAAEPTDAPTDRVDPPVGVPGGR